MEFENDEVDSPSEDQSKAQEFKASGNDKYNNNNITGAIGDYKKGLVHEQNNPDLHANLAAAYICLERFNEAEEHAIYATYLRPGFHKGHMRAAKAAHGKGMTRLALKRLDRGLTKVTDDIGIRELQRLKTQYTAYLSLPANAAREIEFDSDESNDEGEDYQGGDDDDDDSDSDIKNLLALYGVKGETKAESKAKRFESSSRTEDPKVKQGGEEKMVEEPCASKAIAQPPADNDIPLDENDLTEKEPNRFLELCKELTKDPDLKKHVSEFKDLLKNGSEAFLAGNYRNAVKCYRAAQLRVGKKLSDYEIDDRQYTVIKYAICAALINHDTYDDMVQAISGLTEIEVNRLSFPAIYVQMARAFCKLNRYKTALERLEQLQEIVENFLIFPTFSWPGTTETIEETTPAGLKTAIKELNQLCRMQHKPTATCRYDHCLKTSNHIVPSESIYLSDPDFIGYVKVICEEKCHIEFHIHCWKAYKESSSGVKINDKDFIGQACLTMDCVDSNGKPTPITTIEIIGPDGQVKSVNKQDPKASADAQKFKKKKCKIDDKEKVAKPKKLKEKKASREVKKPVTASQEEEDESAEAMGVCPDPGIMALESRKQALAELRTLKFGLEDNYWDPQKKFSGREDESVNTDLGIYLNPKENKGRDPDTDAKEFLFSYFVSILKDEGPLKQSDVEDIWNQSAGDFCDIKVVLPHLKNITDVLGESTCFCLIEDYICLAEQVDDAYKIVKTEVVETVTFLLTGNAEAQEEAKEEETQSNCSRRPSHTPSFNELLISSSDDELDFGDENSGCESEESDEETTEDEDNLDAAAGQIIEEEIEILTELAVAPPNPVIEEKFSLDDMLKEMSRVKNMFMKANSDELESNVTVDEEKSEKLESSSSETFESASSGDSMNTIVRDDIKNHALKELDLVETAECEFAMGSEISNDDKNIDKSENTEELTLNVDIAPSASVNEVLESPDHDGKILQPKDSVSNEGEDTSTAGEQESVDDLNNDKGSQTETGTVEKDIQTLETVTPDTEVQAKQYEIIKHLNKRLREYTLEMLNFEKEIKKINAELSQKEASMKMLKDNHDVIVTNLKKKHSADLEKQQATHEKYKELAEAKEAELNLSHEELLKKKEKIKDLYSGLLTKHNQLKKELTCQQKSATETKELLTTANATIKQLQAGNKTLEKNIKAKVIKAQEFHLQSIKVYWEREINQLRKRCVEKISEMQSWFTMFPPAEVEDLPSWGTIRQTTMQWGEVSKKVQEIEANFQIKYNALETKLSCGEELDELNTLTLPNLPEEPKPLPLDQIHKEITAKHLKKIGELTQLVVSQQLEIEKIKETSQQVQQLMNTFQMVPRVQTPMTTAFGSLALQYPYPQGTTTSFGQSVIPTIPPNQDLATAGSAAKILQADVKTLLQESSKAVSFTSAIDGKLAGTEEISFMGNLGNSPYTIPPEASPMAPPQTPPPVGVAHNLLKASTNLAEKKDAKSEGRSRAQKLEESFSSRESTPAPSSAPTPEKPKKKKKNKSESRDPVEHKVVVSVTDGPATLTNEVYDEDHVEWNVVMPKTVACLSKPISTTAPPPDTKLRNKKRLLDRLLIKFPTVNLKEMDEIVKQLRDENNGSLSGLSFDEIETRVGRIITKRHYLKSSTLGLVKFSHVAWVTVNQDEMISWTNVQNEDCSICLELMGDDRTKVNCNHEFHTKCLRKWLKEKSVCPLCNKFTTMPDEFPAL